MHIMILGLRGRADQWPPHRPSRILLDPVAGRPREARLRGCSFHIHCLSITHEEPHLVIVDVEAGHRAEDIPGSPFDQRHFYRKAPLFDRFLSFDVTLERNTAARH